MRGNNDVSRVIQEHDKRISEDIDEIHAKRKQPLSRHPHNDGSSERYYDQVVSSVAHQNDSQSLRRSGGKRRYGNNFQNDNDGGFLNPTVCHVRRGLVVMPIEMTIPASQSGTSSSAPTYSMKQSNIALYAAFPPPPPIHNNNHFSGSDDDDEYDVNQVKQWLEQYSGFYGAVSTTSATRFGQGYNETMLGLNYRFPTLLSIPLPYLIIQQRRKDRQSYTVLGELHSNVHFGPTSKPSLGGSLSSWDGESSLRLDVSNPFLDAYNSNNSSKRRQEMGILKLYPKSREYTISASHNFGTFANCPIRVHLMTKITPMMNRQKRFQFGYFNIMVSSSQDTTNKNIGEDEATSKSKVSLCVGYGEPSPGGEALWTSQLTSSSGAYSRDLGIDIHKSDYTESGSCSGARVKLDLEQPLSQSQSCQSTIEYHHTSHALSLGTMLTRTSASSKFASTGVGIRHTFTNIFNTGSKWWSKGVTSWIFQIQRGETRIVVPITIHPVAVTAWESFLRLTYASLATLVVDTLVAELLCNEISKLRLKFLAFLLGEESVAKSYALLADRLDERKAQEDESRSLRLQQISRVREEALRQCDLMKRQARNTMKKEEQQEGLVILNAIYGVMDNETGEWLKTSDNSAPNLHMMDATTQLQFWTESSALHMSSVSKQHCLGFYDVLSCVSEEDWKKSEVGSSEDTDPGLFQRLRNIIGMKRQMDHRRDLVVVLRVHYKWAGQEYVKVFHDEDAVDLP